MEIVKPLNENDIDPSLLEKVQCFKGRFGVIPSSVKTLSYYPKIADAFTGLNKAVMECKGTVTPEFKWLIGYVPRFASACLYCQTHTILGAERIGCTKKDWKKYGIMKNLQLFQAQKKLPWTSLSWRHLFLTRLREKKCLIKNYWNDHDIVEIIGVTALFGFLNRWNDSMGSALEDLPIEKGEEHLKKNTNWTPEKK